MEKYRSLMFGFSREELKGFLGQDMVDSLIEWTPSGDDLMTRERLIDMICLLHGPKILKDRKFRRSLLLAMEKREIFSIRDECLSSREKTEQDPTKIVDIIVSKPWSKNKLSLFLLGLWGYPTTIFDKESEDNTVSNVVEPGKRFFELLDYQYYIRQRVLNNLNSGNLQERMLVHMPTGTGKTKTSMHVIANYYSFSLNNKGAVIWVAHTNELLQQAYDTFVDVWMHLGNEPVSVYKLWGNRQIDCTEPLNGIVFCGLAKLMSIKQSSPETFERLKKDCRLLVFDEAHKAAASQTKSVIEDLLRMPAGFDNRALLGLSATPGRTTAESYDNNLLSNMFGNKLIRIDGSILNQINLGRLQALNAEAEENIIKYFQSRRILAKMKPKQLTYQTTFTEKEIRELSKTIQTLELDESDFSKEQLKILALNKDRNRVIMQELRSLYSENIPTIVFACSVSHAKMLSAMLTLEDIPNSLVLGDMDPVSRKNAIETFKDKNSRVNIIINYEVLTTGFDSKNIKCVMITRPTKSVVLYSQMLGRGLRGPQMGGNEECLLIDIDDNLQAYNNETAFGHFNDYWRV